MIRKQLENKGYPVRLHHLVFSPEELLEYEEKKRQAEEEKVPLPELVRAQVPFSSCLEAYGAPEQVDDFWSTALQAKSVAVKYVLWPGFQLPPLWGNHQRHFACWLFAHPVGDVKIIPWASGFGLSLRVPGG